MVLDSYARDDHAQFLLQKLVVHPAADAKFTLDHGVLRCNGHIWVGADPALQQQIISAFHDSPQGGHSGFPVTYRRLVSLFVLPAMKKMVHAFVRSCRTWQQAKPERHPPACLLQPLPIPSEPWETTTMDFIDVLPQSRQFNCILVVVDKLTKYAHFIPLRHPYTASKVVELFVDNIYRLHSMPAALISDRDPVFTSQFWRAVFQATGTQLKMSTANHPETDGQTERVNQSVECYLRCFISDHPQHWSKWLSLCEFWYNTKWHSSLGKSPFELLYGRKPRYFGITASDQVASSDIEQWLAEREVVMASARQHFLRMQQRMKFQADKNRHERVFAVGDEVFLRLQPYIQSFVVKRANHKLAFNFFGPYKIVERIGEVAYKLELPPTSRVHPVFHVSQLKPCIGPHQQVLSQLPPSTDIFQIPVAVLGQRVRQAGFRTVPQALVHWSGMPEDQATWEDIDSLRQQFPTAPAWGQAGFQGEGIVNDPATPSSSGAAQDNVEPSQAEGERPVIRKRAPKWLTDGNWVH